MNLKNPPVFIDSSLPPRERLRQFVSQTQDPYHRQMGDTVVETRWLTTEDTIQDCINGLFENMLY